MSRDCIHTKKCLDAIFNEENKKSSLSRYAALKVRRGRALETGDCAPPGGAAKTGGQPEPAGPVVQGTLEVLLLSRKPILPRKEVIQPHVPVRLPCYDFTPLTLHTFGTSLPSRGWAGDFGCRRLGWCDGRCVQGPGTHSPRRADPRLLATPTSWRRVAASNPNWGMI